MAPAVSVVVPTHQRAAMLARLLSSLRRQRDAVPFEVVVADDGSTDDTRAVVDAAAAAGPFPLRYRRLEHRGPAAARNEGVRAAAGDLVLFVDDDEVADEGLVAAHAAAHEDHPERHQGVVGLVDWAPEVRRTRFIRWLDRSGLQFAFRFMRPGPVVPVHASFVSANLSLKREFMLEHGLFDERFPYAAFEDTELGWRLGRAGFELYYHPEALALHARQFTVSDFAARMRRVGASVALFRQAAPDFPFDERFFLRGPKAWRRAVLVAAAPALRALGPDRLAFRYYDSVAERAYRSGKRDAAR